MTYARIELINEKGTIITGATKNGVKLPLDIDSSPVENEIKKVLEYVQSFEGKELEMANEKLNQVKQELDQKTFELSTKNNELEKTREEVTTTSTKLEEIKEELSKAKSLFAKYDPKVKTYRPGQFLYDETNDKIVVINQEGQAEEAKPIEGAKATF